MSMYSLFFDDSNTLQRKLYGSFELKSVFVYSKSARILI